jgi:hypothetical protein
MGFMEMRLMESERASAEVCICVCSGFVCVCVMHGPLWTGFRCSRKYCDRVCMHCIECVYYGECALCECVCVPIHTTDTHRVWLCL